MHFSTNLTFNNQSSNDFSVTIDATEEKLTLIVEERFEVGIWKGEFTSHYIEEISKKTGKERKYEVVV